MFFVIPEMPSKTFVMLQKKLPDHFNNKVLSFSAKITTKKTMRTVGLKLVKIKLIHFFNFFFNCTFIIALFSTKST